MKTCYFCFKVLSERNRLAIIYFLKKGEKKVSDLVKRFQIGQPTISYHLIKLKKLKMVKAKKKGREVFYSLNWRYLCQNCDIFSQLKL